MSDDEDFTIDASTGNVLLHGELLHNKSSEELTEAAIYRGIDVSKVNRICVRSSNMIFQMSLESHLSLQARREPPSMRS